MKRVVPTEEVCRLWAHQAQDDARNPGGNVFFVGDKIYSYGDHYVMACHHRKGDKHIVLVNENGYSATTKRHRCKVEWALQGVCPYLRVPDVEPGDDHDLNLRFLKDRVFDLILRTVRAVYRKEHHLGALQSLLAGCERYTTFFDMPAIQPQQLYYKFDLVQKQLDAVCEKRWKEWKDEPEYEPEVAPELRTFPVQKFAVTRRRRIVRMGLFNDEP